MLILNRNFRVHLSRETAQTERTGHATSTHQFGTVPLPFFKKRQYTKTLHNYPSVLQSAGPPDSGCNGLASFSQIPPVFAAFSLTNAHRLFVRESEKPCRKRAFVWFFIPHPAAESVPEFLKKSVHSACEMCPAEEGLFVSQMRKQTLPKTACRYAFVRGWRCTGFL